jgi:hypothetical protein
MISSAIWMIPNPRHPFPLINDTLRSYEDIFGSLPSWDYSVQHALSTSLRVFIEFLPLQHVNSTNNTLVCMYIQPPIVSHDDREGR